ncbi:hypothetical protein LDENG_00023870, partial [Lucifuga dentata]
MLWNELKPMAVWNVGKFTTKVVHFGMWLSNIKCIWIVYTGLKHAQTLTVKLCDLCNDLSHNNKCVWFPACTYCP